MRVNKIIYIPLASTIIELIVIFILYSKLPDQIPSHFNSQYVPNDFRPKSFIYILLLIHALILFLLAFTFGFLERIEKFKNYSSLFTAIILCFSLMNLLSTGLTICMSIFKGEIHFLFSAIELIIVLGLLIYVFTFFKRLSK
jgi:uncharacterized membrane protein